MINFDNIKLTKKFYSIFVGILSLLLILTTLQASHGGSYLMTLYCRLTSFSDFGNTVLLSEQRT
ncbi:MAG: hypothetical protein SO069_00005 [Succinivibrio sp.]|nr:hypothetical protein [Succinivibrio sp.]